MLWALVSCPFQVNLDRFSGETVARREGLCSLDALSEIREARGFCCALHASLNMEQRGASSGEALKLLGILLGTSGGTARSQRCDGERGRAVGWAVRHRGAERTHVMVTS